MSLTSYRAAPPRVWSSIPGWLFPGVVFACRLVAWGSLVYFVYGLEDLAATYSPVP